LPILDFEFLRKKLSLPERVVPLMTIIFGFPDGNYPPMPPKLALGQICFSQAYEKPDQAAMKAWYEQMRAGYKASYPFSSFEKPGLMSRFM